MDIKTQLKTEFKDWLFAVGRENIPHNIKAWSFELSEPYRIDLIGSTDFDEDDSDWACPDNDDFYPETEAPDLSVLAGQDWEIVQKIIVEIVQGLEDELADIPFFQIPHIAVGFVDGDLTIIR
ncbi:TPA: hypothetical protein WIW84_000724 [Neisseria meningitidis]|uniref:hypothetical protein n=1 Tax=Neisseria meningitidis TaxID=487 RepID=UPI000BB66D23|nr:hypothetical protein [Neisseria meningitidis]RPC11711.1 hypothetical protein JY28_04820 [Neisseria meningitidis]